MPLITNQGVEGFLENLLNEYSDKPSATHPILVGFQLGLITAFGFTEYARMIHAMLESAQVQPSNQDLEQTLLVNVMANPIEHVTEEVPEG